MKFWWKIRIYNEAGQYGICQIETIEGTNEIDAYQDFYFRLTGCKLLLEGMSQVPFQCLSLGEAFKMLWEDKRNG